MTRLYKGKRKKKSKKLNWGSIKKMKLQTAPPAEDVYLPISVVAGNIGITSAAIRYRLPKLNWFKPEKSPVLVGWNSAKEIFNFIEETETENETDKTAETD